MARTETEKTKKRIKKKNKSKTGVANKGGSRFDFGKKFCQPPYERLAARHNIFKKKCKKSGF